MTTEKSADDAVLDDVFDSGRDRGGKSAPPEADAGKSDPPTDQQQPAPAPQDQQDPDAGRMVPLSELTGERKKLKGRLDEESRARIAAEERAKLLQEQLERAAQQSRQAPQRQPVEIPDPVTDPEQYARFVHGNAANAVFQDRLDRSEERARDKYGDAAVDEAFQAAIKAGLIERQHFIRNNPRHPWGGMMEWHQQQKVLAEVGDPAAYRKKIEEEIRAKVLEELKAGNGIGAGAQQPRFPGTLADATATGPQGAHLTEEAALASVFASDRKRK